MTGGRRGRDAGPFPQLKSFRGALGGLWGRERGKQLSWARTGKGILGLRMGEPRGAISIAHGWGGGPGEADLSWVVPARGWRRSPEL